MFCCTNGVKRWGDILVNGRNDGYVLCKCDLGKARKKADKERIEKYKEKYNKQQKND